MKEHQAMKERPYPNNLYNKVGLTAIVTQPQKV